MAGLYFLWLVAAAMCSVSSAAGSGNMTIMCDAFSSFPESIAVSTGADICFLCDYPGEENEMWSTSCAADQDGMCSCSIIDLSPGIQLCFTSFHLNCSGNYLCNVSVQTTGIVCSEQADIVATDDRFTEHPANVTAVQGNNVSFDCALMSGSSVLWQRSTNTSTTFVTADTHPGNYILGAGNTLSIDGVQSDNVGQYRCAYEVQEGNYLFSDFGELNFLGEGVTLSLETTAYSLREGGTAEICIMASGSIPDSYDIDFSVLSYNITAQSAADYEMVNFSRTLVAIQNQDCVEAVFINTTNDSLVEAAEQFSISLTSNSFIVAITNSSLLVTIPIDDYSVITWDSTSYEVGEGDGITQNLCITSSGVLQSNLMLGLAVHTSDDTATEGLDYTSIIPTNAAGTGSGQYCMVVTIIDDDIVDGNETFLLAVESDQEFIQFTNHTTSITIIENDNIRVAFAELSYTFVEGAGSTSLSVTYDKEPQGFSVSVDVTSSSGTATDSVDYTTVNEGLLISQGSGLSAFLPINIIDDRIVEATESFSLTLTSDSSLIDFVMPNTTIFINDDEMRVDIDFVQSAYTFNEYDGTREVCATTLNETTYDFNVNINIQVEDVATSSATVGVDYTSTTFAVSLLSGETSVCTDGTLIEDDEFEGTESFYLIFINSNPSVVFNSDSGGDGSRIQTQIFIVDNSGFTETPGNVSAPLGSGSVDFNCSGSVSLAFLVNGENVSSLPLSRGITVTVGPEGDTVSGVLTVPVIEENNNTVVVCRLKSGELQSTSPLAVLTITDFSGFVVGFERTEYSVEEGSDVISVCLRVELRNILEPTQASVGISTEDRTATSGIDATDFTSFSRIINLDSESSTTLLCKNLTVTDDESVEGTEDLVLSVTVVTVPVMITTQTATVMILDNDLAVVGLETTFYSVLEDVGVVEVCAIIYNPNISCPIAFPFGVHLSTGDNTAEAPIDYGSLSLILMFATCETRRCVTVTIVDDMVNESEELFDITLSRTSGLDSRITLNPIDGRIVISDNDETITVGYEFSVYNTNETAGMVQICAIIYEPTTGGAPRDFIVSSTTQDGSAIAGGDYVSESVNLIFAPGSMRECHTVSLLQDDECEQPPEDFFADLAYVSGIQPINIPIPTTQVSIHDFGEPECGQTCGDLLCQNGGECVDDFLCICPPDYSGPECRIRIVQQPTLEIQASTPQLNNGYQATCQLTADSQRNLDESVGAVEMQWLESDGQPVNRTDVTVGVIMIIDNRASLALNFSSLTTSHAGYYTCRASLDDEEIPLVLEQQLNVTFTLPAPTSVALSQLPFGSVTAGETLVLTCSSVLADSITSPVLAIVEWTLNDGESIPVTPRLSISRTSAFTPAVFVSTLSISPLLESDSSTYVCRVYFTPIPESSEYLSSSEATSESYLLAVDELSIPIMLTTESDSIPSVPPYNTFQFTCEADVPALLGSVPFELQWFRETGPEQQQPVSPDSSTSIETSDTEPVSVLTATRSSPGQYVYYCEIRYLSGDDVVAFASSISNGVTVTGASNPAPPTNVKVNGTGVDFVVIQWTVSRLAFTPETYYVEFTNGETVAMSVQYPTTNSNFSATNVEYTFFVNGLEADSTYEFVVVAVNSNGEMRTPDSFLFQTRDEEPFSTLEGETDFAYPIGALIELIFTYTNNPLDGSGDMTNEFVFVPESHTPLQQPRVNVLTDFQGETTRVEYSAASPSLTGSYVLCSLNEEPLLCGGRISLTVTVPSLSISIDLLVSQYVDGRVIDGTSPELMCLPSDPRAPVQWSTLPVFIDLERDYGVQFVPFDLNHTIRFPRVYEQLPAGSVTVVCDLIDVEEPGVAIDPMEATIIFVQNAVTLLNNARVLEPNAVINIFSLFEDVEYLSLGCVGTAGSGQLQWEAREVERFSGLIDDSVLSTNDDITVEYYTPDRRDTVLVLQPITQDTVGYYTCKSDESSYEATVLTTFQNPYFAFTSPTELEVPLGVRIDISARYAYWSNGSMNVGTGFLYNLTFLPCILMPPNSNGTAMLIPQDIEQLIDSGFTDAFSNNYVYTLYASENTTGQYNLTFQYVQTQEVYQQTVDIIVTIPYIVMYEPEIVAKRDQLVTISCIPNDLRAPVLWNIELDLRQTYDVRFLHNYPQYFTFNPPTLRHMVTFNVSVVSQLFPVRSTALFFNCGFMNGEDDENIFNSTAITVTLQDDTIQLDHAFTDLRIFNNTVINQLTQGEGLTSPQPLNKRGSPVENSLYVDCLASQGNHEPVWTTFNPIVGGATGTIAVGDGYRVEMLSDYMARLSFEYFDPAFTGIYKCLSGRSNAFAEIFITTENLYVVSVSPSNVSVIEGSPVTMEFKISVDSDGNTWDTANIYFTFSSAVLDEEYPLSFSVRNSEFPQNYIYSIERVDRTQEGLYTATAASGEDNAGVDSISLNVTRRCPVEVNGGIQWQWTLEGTTVSKPCSDAGSMFRTGPRGSRRCNEEGEWDEADLTSCTLAEIEEPFLLVWFVIEVEEYTDDMEQGFVDNMKMLLDMNGVVYSRVSLQSAYVASVSLAFQVDLGEGDQSENIMQFSTFLGNSEAFSSFGNYTVMQDGRGLVDISVSETCMCSSANLGSSLQLCSGAAISPCNCMGAICLCQAPFVGDGISCTLDSDLDGYPDQALDSPSCTADASLTYCIADVCPEVNNTEQNPVTCQRDATAMQVFTGCPYGPDDVWGITWPNAPGGLISSQPCPGGVDAVGTATRMCNEDGTWGEPNVLSCQSLDILRVSQEAGAVLPEADAVILEVTPELLESATVISEQLVMATDSEDAVGLLPLDLNTTNNVVAQVLNVLESSVEDRIVDTSNEELVEVFNNILNETNQVGWTELQTVASGSQTLLQNAERYGAYLARTVNNTDDSVVLVRENIIVNAEVVDISNVSDITFPTSSDELDNFTVVEMDDSAQITIPAGAITKLSAGNSSADLAIVHIIFRNIEDFLPANTSVLSESRSASLVISSQFGGRYQTDIPDDVFLENPITLNFSFTKNTDVVTNYAGVFWNFSDPVGSGGWSSEGVQVISNITRGSVTTVLCNSTHLTSFAVLVDVAGGLEDVSEDEQLALQVISYIGCIISTICLSITVVFYLAMGKKLFSSVHYFVHLNLALSLLLGYVVFLFGIELGTSSKGGCAFVAALLQYLFLSAFCWMMCEGIMLYLMLIVVFSKLSNKWWFFMLLGYCTPLIFVVVGLAARSDYYGVRGDDGELSFCWLSSEKGTIFAFVAPMIAIIIINTVFLVLALVALGRSKKQKAKTVKKDNAVNQATTILRATLILLPLLGLTWLFGLLTLNRNATVFAWLFTIFNSLQGAAIFIFHVVRNDKVWSKISPGLSYLKQHTFKSSLKYNLSTYSGSGDQSSTGTMRTLLHKKPVDSKDSYAPSERVMSSITNESETDTEKKPLEPIPEGGDTEGGIKCSDPISEKGAGGVEKEPHTEEAGDGDVIHNPNTSDGDEKSTEEQNREEVSML